LEENGTHFIPNPRIENIATIMALNTELICLYTCPLVILFTAVSSLETDLGDILMRPKQPDSPVGRQ
jgi:hypothetical protein